MLIVAKTAGFCFGVKRAVDQVYRQIEEGKKPIYTYGPIIHNEEVVRELVEKGVRIVETEEELRKLRRRNRDHSFTWSAGKNLQADRSTGARNDRCDLSVCEKNSPDRAEP